MTRSSSEGHADLARERDGVGGDAAAVALGLGVAQVEGVAHGLEGDVVGPLEVLHGGAETAGAGVDDFLQVLQVGVVLALEPAVLDGAGDDVEELRCARNGLRR